MTTTAGDSWQREWLTFVVDLPGEAIQLLCVFFEAYDNLALVRTPEPGRGRVYVYTYAGNRGLVEKILTDIDSRHPLRIAGIENGMKDVSGLWE